MLGKLTVCGIVSRLLVTSRIVASLGILIVIATLLPAILRVSAIALCALATLVVVLVLVS